MYLTVAWVVTPGGCVLLLFVLLGNDAIFNFHNPTNLRNHNFHHQRLSL